MNEKKGISAVIATVLLILITVAAVTIIWAAVIPMIRGQIESGTSCLDATKSVTVLNKGYTCTNADSTGDGDVSVQISRGSGEFTLSDVMVYISAGGTSKSYSLMTDGSYTVGDLPGVNEEKVFTITLAESDFDEAPTQVEIAPVVISEGSTSETTCDKTSSVVLEVCPTSSP